MFQLQIFFDTKITHPQQKHINSSKAVRVLTKYTSASAGTKRVNRQAPGVFRCVGI